MNCPAHTQAWRPSTAFFYEDLTRAELFVTMFYLKYEIVSRRLSFANAGHNHPLIWRAQTAVCERLDAEGLILGVRRDIIFEERQTLLAPGDLLLLYTDGITEAEDSNGQFFGEERLCTLLREHCQLPAEEIIEQMLLQARLFTGLQNFHDDVSLVVMKVE